MGMITPVAVGRVFVGEEPDDEDIAILAASGFRSLVCLTREPVTRDAVEDDDRERAAADAAGLAFLRLASSGTVTPQMVRAFREMVRMLPRPIYLHCGFGQVAAALALVAEADLLPDPADTIDTLAERGIRLTPRMVAEVARLRAETARAERRAVCAVPNAGGPSGSRGRPWSGEFSAVRPPYAPQHLAIGAYSR